MADDTKVGATPWMRLAGGEFQEGWSGYIETPAGVWECHQSAQPHAHSSYAAARKCAQREARRKRSAELPAPTGKEESQ